MRKKYQWAIALEKVNHLDTFHFLGLLMNLGYATAKKVMRTPWRDDHSPSLGWFHKNGKWRWKDFGTGEVGDVIDFLRKAEGLSYPEAAQRILDALKGIPTSTVPTKVERVFEVNNHLYKEKKIREILREGKNVHNRGAQYILTKHGFYEPDAKELVDHLYCKGHLYIWPDQGIGCPYYLGKQIVGVTRRSPDGNKRDFGKKGLVIIPGSPRSKEILVVEGIRDLLAGWLLYRDKMIQLIALGGSPSVEALAMLRTLAQDHRVVIATDNDQGGEAIASTLEYTLKGLTYRRMRFLYGNDVFDHYVQLRQKERKALLQNSFLPAGRISIPLGKA